MNEMENLINAIAELTKHGIDMNSNFSEWEKWWRKSGVEEVKKFAKQFYGQQHIEWKNNES